MSWPGIVVTSYGKGEKSPCCARFLAAGVVQIDCTEARYPKGQGTYTVYTCGPKCSHIAASGSKHDISIPIMGTRKKDAPNIQKLPYTM